MRTLAGFGVVAAVLAFASWAAADDAKKGTATVGAKSVVTFKVARTFVDGEPLAAGTFTLPAEWKFAGNSFETLEFEPKWAKYGRPQLSIAVSGDNLDPEKVAAAAKEQVNAFKGKVPGGGKLVKTVTDTKDLAPGGKVHGVMASYEIDATAERHVHYIETMCTLWIDGDKFYVMFQGSAEMADAKAVPDFEKICTTASLATK